jgi:ribosomal protein S18 acetylase RimI-like enzyme
MYVLRPPVSSDRDVISELILQSDCGTLPALFGPSVTSLLVHLQNRSDNPYSFTNTLVIADAARSPSVVGAMIGSLVVAIRRANLRTAGHLFTWYGPGFMTRIPRLLRAGKALDDLLPDDFYLSHIAVLPEQRGRGAGSQLMHAAEERAKRLGARRIALDVEEHNERAGALYTRLGYRQVSIVRIDLGRRGLFTFLRMHKGL